MLSGSTGEHEQQQQTQNAHEYPVETEKDTSLLSSVAIISLSHPENQFPPYDMWGLPMLDHFERTLPPDVKRGKDEIAAYLAKGHVHEELSCEGDSYELSSVARMLSNGSSDSLVGMTLLLKNVKPLHWMDNGGHLPRLVRITQILGKGSSAIVVEAEDTDAHELFAMRILRKDANFAKWFQTDEAFIAEIRGELDFEEEGARQLCGVIPANMVGLKKGIAVPLYTADIAGAPEAQRAGRYFVLGRVQLMERFFGDMIDLHIHAKEVVEKSREYIARRLVNIVLKIQQAGLSHNDLKWDNMLLSADGSFLVADLGSALPFGSPCRQLTFFTPQYREPQLALRLDPEAYESGFIIPQASSDLWSLGILLYELFTTKTSPYGEMRVNGREDPNVLLATWLIETNTRSATLEPILEAAKVPSRWKELILRLLEPRRLHRITSWEIQEEFPDLVHNP
ncbi:hypothetical protein, conserved [Eimeria acervulina]|uniref:Protein kinase domain-containing protein n=1 Tax=Eimeria acervulina TaxID=5801 RepID=U6GUR1_EIMAC|nr:hypothetical protein, conserved [Eimeria acervulina]CDI83302.1 hypothetical protein, conserved [Eimeria acervulina]